MYLTFSKFTISDDIPMNGNLRIHLDPLTNDDWTIPNATCEGTSIYDQN